MVRIKRVYEAPSDDDGHRVLVDRLWPRGLKRESAALDRWAKEIAPSHELRTWFDHDPARWETFQERYRKELGSNAEAGQVLEELNRMARRRDVTLLYAAATPLVNHALVLEDILSKRIIQND